MVFISCAIGISILLSWYSLWLKIKQRSDKNTVTGTTLLVVTHQKTVKAMFCYPKTGEKPETLGSFV